MPFRAGTMFLALPDRTWSDDAVWRYARQENIDVIVTVTRDFDSERLVLAYGAPPKVLRRQLGAGPSANS